MDAPVPRRAIREAAPARRPAAVAAVKRADDIDMALVGVGRVVGHRTSATIVPRFLACPLFWGVRASRVESAFRRHSQTKDVSARSSSARRRAIPDAHAPILGRSRIARGIRLLRRHSQTKDVSARSSSARRRAIPDAHAPILGRSRIARGIRLLRRHSQTKDVSARSSSARRRAIPDAHAPILGRSRTRLRPGVSDGTRTRDILDHNQVLYQLSYTHHARAPEPVPRATPRSVKCTGRPVRAGSQFSLGTAPVRAP